MPALLPAPNPRFSCSIRRACGNFSPTRSGVPSVESLSTTITSAPVPRRLSSERSIQGAALCVTRTALTSGSAICFARNPRAATRPMDALPREDQRARDRHQDRDHEEEEPGRERLVGAHAHLTEEADEERLAHREPVDRERDQHHEEEERPHDVVRPWREVDPDCLAAEPDGQDADRLHAERDEEDREQDAHVVAVRVHRVVDAGDEVVEADPRKYGSAELEQRPCAAREEQEAKDDRRDDEERLDPELGAA